MAKRYDQYCPVAHALELVGERWALLVVRELMRGPKRYTDLADALGIGTNILAARLRDLEACGVVTARKLPPPAASRVYELTDYGRQLKATVRELALWGARSLGPPTAEHEMFTGWLENALDTILAPVAPPGRFEFHAGGEVASIVDGEARSGPADNPDVVVEGEPAGLYYMFVDRRLDHVSVAGDQDLLGRLLDAAQDQAGRTLAPAAPAPDARRGTETVRLEPVTFT
jgi:DNA-binding HxlR family transcriptional regulator